MCKQSGCTTGRLGSTGLLAMPSEGRHSRHSGAYLPQLLQLGLDTISDDYGPATTCRTQQPEEGHRSRRRSPRDSLESAVGLPEQLADDG